MMTFRMQTVSIFFFTVILVVTGLICFDSRCNGSFADNYPSASWFDHETSSAGYHNLCGEGYRCINRRVLEECSDQNPDLRMNLSTQGPLPDEEFITVTINGLSNPTDDIWVALVSPSSPNISDCPLNLLLYLETGDTKPHSLLCHYTVKSQFLKSDPSYRACTENRNSSKLLKAGEEREPETCNGSVTFHVINIRTDVEFVLLSGGYDNPCILQRSEILKFSNPNMPLYAHLSSVDSTGSSMKVTWISGSNTTQFVQYGARKSAMSTVTTFTRADMCSNDLLPSPAMDFGWHDPGYIHTALMTGLLPSQKYSYRYGSNNVGWSSHVSFSTPPASGASEVRFLAFGDMGKAPRDESDEHYIQPGSLGVIDAMTEEVSTGKLDSVFHIGDISYATGFLVEWDFFLQMITPVASRLSYMTAIGNHERDYPNSGSKYGTSRDSGGECGVPYEKYFPMPTIAEDKPWYSINQGPVHFTVMSTEHNWTEDSEQYEWIKQDLASVDRKQTPWLIFTGHRPMYSSVDDGVLGIILPSVDADFAPAIEPLLLDYQVDLVLWGHVHNYERTCALFQKTCKSLPTKDADGVDTYNSAYYSAPVHAVIGMAGFSLDKFVDKPDSWSLVRMSEYGYARVHATTQLLLFEFVSSDTRAVKDSFQMTRKSSIERIHQFDELCSWEVVKEFN